MPPDLKAVRVRDFEAVVSFGLVVELRLSGASDVNVAAPLHGLVDQLHAAVRDAGIKEVVVDIASLEFMNAGSFKVFVAWIGRINELEPDQRYRLRFLSNANIRWQRRSLDTLSCFATDIVKIREVA